MINEEENRIFLNPDDKDAMEISKFIRDKVSMLLGVCNPEQIKFFYRLYPNGPDGMNLCDLPNAIRLCRATIKKNHDQREAELANNIRRNILTDTKECSECGKTKKVVDFHASYKCRSKHSCKSICKSCTKRRIRKRGTTKVSSTRFEPIYNKCFTCDELYEGQLKECEDCEELLCDDCQCQCI